MAVAISDIKKRTHTTNRRLPLLLVESDYAASRTFDYSNYLRQLNTVQTENRKLKSSIDTLKRHIRQLKIQHDALTDDYAHVVDLLSGHS